jgi:hydrogenase maturation protease
MGIRARTVVAGIGNLMMTDDGVGIRILRRVQEGWPHRADVDFLEVGASSLGACHAIANRACAILLDCCLMGAVPGTIRRFSPSRAVSRKQPPGLSLHEGDVMQAMALSRRLGEYPREVIVFGVEPVSMAPGDGLSPPLQECLESYAELVLHTLRRMPGTGAAHA